MTAPRELPPLELRLTPQERDVAILGALELERRRREANERDRERDARRGQTWRT